MPIFKISILNCEANDVLDKVKENGFIYVRRMEPVECVLLPLGEHSVNIDEYYYYCK